MRVTLAAHILAGGLALVSGFVALCPAKGARLHRKSGIWDKKQRFRRKGQSADICVICG